VSPRSCLECSSHPHEVVVSSEELLGGLEPRQRYSDF